MANNFDLRKFLNENKLTRASKSLNENLNGVVELYANIDENDVKAMAAYDKLGFKLREDDEDSWSAELKVTEGDWMGILAILEDCERMGVMPSMLWNGQNYEFQEAMKLADEKAAGGINESADSDEILEVINQLIEMGEEGQTALNILAKVPAWQAIVDRSSDM